MLYNLYASFSTSSVGIHSKRLCDLQSVLIVFNRNDLFKDIAFVQDFKVMIEQTPFIVSLRAFLFPFESKIFLKRSHEGMLHVIKI